MEASLSREILFPLKLGGFYWSLFWAVNIALAGFSFFCILAVMIRDGRLIVRPAFMIAVLLHILFQWPLAIFSLAVERSLPELWFFAASVHITVLTLIIWLAVTRRLTIKLVNPGGRSIQGHRTITFKSEAVLVALLISLALFYIGKVGWKCTGLYALIFDPEMTLLARETSGKILGTGLAAYGHGILVNVVCPFVFYISLAHISDALIKKRVFVMIAWMLILVISFLSALLPGAKGAIQPIFIFSGIVYMARENTWVKRIVFATLAIGLGLVLMTALQVILKQAGTGCYDFAACVSSQGKCQTSKNLIQSLRYRDLSLGLSIHTVDEIERDLSVACSDPHSYESRRCRNNRYEAPNLSETVVHRDSETVVHRDTDVISNQRYFQAVLYRIFVVPVQVAGWYHLYVAEHGSPGLCAFPFTSRLCGNRVDMPLRIQEQYHHIYSGDDRTATGTVPTSFLLAYPAYLGFFGIVLSLFAVLVFDLVACSILALVSSHLRIFGIALLAITCVNFMLSDFGTVLLTHGAVAGLILLAILSYIEGKFRSLPDAVQKY